MISSENGNASTITTFAMFIIISVTFQFLGLADQFPEFMAWLWGAGAVLLCMRFSENVLNTRNDRICFYLVLFVRIAYLSYLHGFDDLQQPNLSSDSAGFWLYASRYYAGDFGGKYTNFPYVLNFMFHIFGKNIFCCFLVNILCGAFGVVFFAEVLNRFDVYGNKRTCLMFIACLMPYMTIECMSLHRENLYFIFLTLSFFFFVKFVLEDRLIFAFLAMAATLPVLLLHSGYFPLMIVYFYYALKKLAGEEKKVWEIAGLVFVMVLLLLVASRAGATHYVSGAGGKFSVPALIERLTSSGEMGNRGGSAYMQGVKISNLRDLLIYGPIKVIFYLFSPLPMNWRGISDIGAFFLDGAVHFVLLFLSIRGIRNLKSLVRIESCIAARDLLLLSKCAFWGVILCAVVFAQGTGTAGTAIRHRDVMLGIELLAAALPYVDLEIFNCTRKAL